jgi:hypothetical protein
LQIMLLAWPGVVVQFLLIALCAKYFFPYGWSWPESFLFGAMMSATDPVAVVAVLQEVRRGTQEYHMLHALEGYASGSGIETWPTWWCCPAMPQLPCAGHWLVVGRSML